MNVGRAAYYARLVREGVGEAVLDLPVGTISFFMTVIEGSTRLWEEQPAALELALQQHDEMAAQIIALRDGVLVKRRGEGDSLFAVFDRPSDAVSAAMELQQYLLSESFEGGIKFRVRIDRKSVV